MIKKDEIQIKNKNKKETKKIPKPQNKREDVFITASLA